MLKNYFPGIPLQNVSTLSTTIEKENSQTVLPQPSQEVSADMRTPPPEPPKFTKGKKSEKSDRQDKEKEKAERLYYEDEE